MSLHDPTTLSHTDKVTSDLFFNGSNAVHQVISYLCLLFTLEAVSNLWCPLVGSNLGARNMGTPPSRSKDKGLFTKNHNLFKSIFCSVLSWCHVSFRVCFYFSLMCLLLLCLFVLEKYPYRDHVSNLRFLWSSHIELYTNNNNNIIASDLEIGTINVYYYKYVIVFKI